MCEILAFFESHKQEMKMDRKTKIRGLKYERS